MISKALSELMGAESEHTAVFSLIMRWEWLKRLPVEKAQKFFESTVCPLCVRHRKSLPKEGFICGDEKCPFYEICECAQDGSLYSKAFKALNASNERNWSCYSVLLCNALWKRWNKLFEEPKEERTYEIGDRFDFHSAKYRLCLVDNFKCNLIHEKTYVAWSGIVDIEDGKTITQKEFDKMCGSEKGEITLIESKTGKEGKND